MEAMTEGQLGNSGRLHRILQRALENLRILRETQWCSVAVLSVFLRSRQSNWLMACLALSLSLSWAKVDRFPDWPLIIPRAAESCLLL